MEMEMEYKENPMRASSSTQPPPLRRKVVTVKKRRATSSESLSFPSEDFTRSRRGSSRHLLKRAVAEIKKQNLDFSRNEVAENETKLMLSHTCWTLWPRETSCKP